MGATYVYYFSFFTGYAAATAVLVVATLIFPINGLPDAKLFERKFFEEWQEVEDFDDVFRQKAANIHDNGSDVIDELNYVVSAEKSLP